MPITEGQLQDLQNQFQLDAPLNNEMIIRYELVRQKLLGTAIDLLNAVPTCNERDIAINRLNEVMFWCNAGITRHLTP